MVVFPNEKDTGKIESKGCDQSGQLLFGMNLGDLSCEKVEATLNNFNTCAFSKCLQG